LREEHARRVFRPKRVLVESAALEYPLGKKIHDMFCGTEVDVKVIPSHNRIVTERGLSARQAYTMAKSTLVVGVRKSKKFETCRPSADFQLPLVTSCPGMCRYCYLLTTLGRTPYVRVYVNVQEMLDIADEYARARQCELTTFEGAATGDPLAVEEYTRALANAIEHFGKCSHARFRFVSKFAAVDSLLELEHARHTEIRFSVNAREVIRLYEQGTDTLTARLDAAAKAAVADYPVGFMVAPIIVFDGWEAAYERLFGLIQRYSQHTEALQTATFELVTHRFTPRAKARVLELFEDAHPDMEESSRKFIFGQFGYGKYVYEQDTMQRISALFDRLLRDYMPKARRLYLV